MKRRILTVLTILLISISLQAQDSTWQKNPGRIGFTYSSFGGNQVVINKDLIGAGSYDSGNFYSLGINYLRPITTWLELETGLEYSKHTVLAYSAPLGMSTPPHKAGFSLVNIPLTVRANFWKFLFVNGGLFLDLDLNDSSSISQTGIGGLLGIGTKYDFDFGGSVFMNPYLKLHSLVPFENNNQKIYESGIRFGLAYNLKGKK